MKAECPDCGWTRKVPERARGKKGECPECGSVFYIGNRQQGQDRVQEEPPEEGGTQDPERLQGSLFSLQRQTSYLAITSGAVAVAVALLAAVATFYMLRPRMAEETRERLGGIERSLQRLEDQQEEMRQRLGDLEGTFRGAQEQVSAVREQASEAERRVADLRTAVDELRAQAEAAEMTAAVNALGLAELQEKLEKPQSGVAEGETTGGEQEEGRQRQARNREGQSPAFADIESRMEELTPGRRREYARSLEGTRVSWSGWVADLRRKYRPGYRLTVDMNRPGRLGSRDAYFDMPANYVYFDVPLNVALSLSGNQRVSFTGTIASITYHEVLGGVSVRLVEAEVMR